MNSTLSILATLTLTIAMSASAGCKGETKFKDRQETLDKLSATEASLKEKSELVQTLNARVTELQMAGGTVVISMEGPKANGEPGAILEIKGSGPNGRGSGDRKGNAKDTQLYEAFVAKVKGSRGSVKKCYEGALKKRSDLQAKAVTVVMTVDYRTSGKVSSSSFQPTLTPEFGSCMKTVAARWTLPAMPAASRFTYRQKLTPQ